MRHKVKGRKLGRTSSHRLATLKSLATELFRNKKIKTTLAKAREARTFSEPLITKAKTDSVHSRRHVARFVEDKGVVQELFSEIIPKIGDRPGGYTRIIKLGKRLGDASEMAFIELVDYNEAETKKKTKKKSKTAAKKKAEPKSETDSAAEPVKKSAGKTKKGGAPKAEKLEEKSTEKIDEPKKAQDSEVNPDDAIDSEEAEK